MKRAFWATLLLTMIVMAACVRPPEATVTPAPTVSAEKAQAPTIAPLDTAAPQTEPNVTPTLTLIPTAAEVAPDKTFIGVGAVAMLEGGHGITGKCTVAGLQTLIIQGFSFDGKGPVADVRLIKKGTPDDAAAILLVLEQRPYDQETHVLKIPSSVNKDNVDSLAIYCPETQELYAIASFR